MQRSLPLFLSTRYFGSTCGRDGLLLVLSLLLLLLLLWLLCFLGSRF